MLMCGAELIQMWRCPQIVTEWLVHRCGVTRGGPGTLSQLVVTLDRRGGLCRLRFLGRLSSQLECSLSFTQGRRGCALAIYMDIESDLFLIKGVDMASNRAEKLCADERREKKKRLSIA